MDAAQRLIGIGRRRLLAVTGSLLAAPGIVRAQGQNGVALVIGNSKYIWEASLPNVKRDVADIGRCFETMGLRTELVQDANLAAMNQALEKFKAAARGAPLAAFYFAGHGAVWAKNTYLVPVNTDLSDPSTVKSLVPMRAIFDSLQEANARLLVFDNCRNNPADGWRQQETLERSKGSGTSLLGEGNGLPSSTMAIYSTAPGRAALDGPAGENSPFASALMRTLAVKSVDLAAIGPKVRRELLIETEGRQLAWAVQTFGASHVAPGAGAAFALRPAHTVDPARIVELKKGYALAKEIQSPLPNGIVAIRPPKGAPGDQFIGSYKFIDRSTVTFLWCVLSAADGKCEIVMSQRSDGKPFWRFFQGAFSGNTLDAQSWDGGQHFVLKWRDASGGSVTMLGLGRELKSMPYTTTFTRLDG